MHMGTDDLRDPASQKIPNHYAAVVATHGEKCSVFVEAASYGQRDAIKGSIVLFRKVLTK